jgi:hypothetical protein
MQLVYLDDVVQLVPNIWVMLEGGAVLEVGLSVELDIAVEVVRGGRVGVTGFAEDLQGGGDGLFVGGGGGLAGFGGHFVKVGYCFLN